MATIPLPALGIQQQPGPIDQFSKIMQLKNLAAQQQLIPGQLQQQQQNLQLGQQDIQKNQMGIDSTKALNKSYQNAVKPDANGVPQIDTDAITKSLASDGYGSQIPGVLENINKFNKSTIDIQNAKAELQSKGNDLLGAAAAAIKAGDYNPALAHTIVDTLPPSPQIQAFRAKIDDPAQLKQLVDQALAGSPKQQELATAKETADARATSADNQSKELAAKMPGGPLADTGRAEMQDWLTKNPGKGPADYEIAMKKIVPAYNFNLQNQGATGTAGQPSAIAKGIADGSVKWNEVVSARTPMATKQALLSEVKGIKPDFNSGDATIERNVLNSAVSGPIGQNLTAFNTAIEHAKQLSDATDALGNGNVVTLNKIGNALGYQFGSDKTTNFNVVKNAVSGEISKVFKGGGATDAEIEAVQGPFNAANSPAQLKGAITQAISLMNSKRDALKQQVSMGSQAKPNFGTDAAQSGATSAHVPGGKAAGLTEGATGTGSDGKKYVVKGGVWVTQ